MAKVLEGIRIADLSHALAAPSGTKLLGDLGAEVVKVERIEGGDFTRRLVPWVFESFNRSKKSIAVDLKSSDGIDVIRRLAASSDVFVQAFRPGVVKAMGLGRDALTALNPKLIYVTFSGFGPEGPDAGRRGLDGLLQAESGMLTLQGRILGSTSYVDQTAGLLLSNAILAALLHRERTGEVNHVELNLLESALYLQTAPILEYSITGHQLDQVGHEARNPTNAVFTAADGPMYIAAFWDDDWAAMCEILGIGEYIKDPRFLTLADRQTNADAIRAVVGPALANKPRRLLIHQLERRGIVAGEVRDYGEVLANAQVKASQSIETLPVSSGENGAFVRTPFRLSGFPDRDSTPAPMAGENTREILAALGFSDDHQADLRARGVVA